LSPVPVACVLHALPVAIALVIQSPPRGTPGLRAGLDTLYAGDFAAAAVHFAELAARDSTDPAPLVFQASAYIWWASALDSAAFERPRVDSLLERAMQRARAAGRAADFWLGTAHGYRARQRDLHGETFGAAKDAKAMRDAYRRVLAADSSCVDCYLGLGVYHYGLGRASTLAKIVARLLGLGGGRAETGLEYLRHVARDGDLARVEAAWVLAAALVREAARDPANRPALEGESRRVVEALAARYPDNPVFRRFLAEIPARPDEGER
jgi:hypothetical protein